MFVSACMYVCTYVYVCACTCVYVCVGFCVPWWAIKGQFVVLGSLLLRCGLWGVNSILKLGGKHPLSHLACSVHCSLKCSLWTFSFSSLAKVWTMWPSFLRLRSYPGLAWIHSGGIEHIGYFAFMLTQPLWLITSVILLLLTMAFMSQCFRKCQSVFGGPKPYHSWCKTGLHSLTTTKSTNWIWKQILISVSS